MFAKRDPKEIRDNVFSAIGKGWMLISAGMDGHCNPMTASWGGLGVLWGKDVATIYVRPQRYTYTFLEGTDCFALNFFTEEHRETLNFCGSRSGRDVDKVAACGLTVAKAECGAPYFEQARLVLICRKLYAQDFDLDKFVDPSIPASVYSGEDLPHRMYIGEILEVLEQQ